MGEEEERERGGEREGKGERERGMEGRERERESFAPPRHGGGGNSHANVSRDCLMLPSDGG